MGVCVSGSSGNAIREGQTRENAEPLSQQWGTAGRELETELGANEKVMSKCGIKGKNGSQQTL